MTMKNYPTKGAESKRGLSRRLALCCLLLVGPVFGQAVDELNPTVGPVMCIALQPDHKILVGGAFTKVSGKSRQYIARLHRDGSLDNSFTAAANEWVESIAVQEDGRILVAGRFEVLNNQPRAKFGRLNPDGTLDAAFDPRPDGSVLTIAIQADGKIVAGGFFSKVAGYERQHLVRLHPDGTVDTSFTAQVPGFAQYLTMQPDGKILVGCTAGILRLNSNGTPDVGFTPISFLGNQRFLLQPDGKILTGHKRYEANGLLDPSFDTGLSGLLRGIALQADGKVLLAGKFVPAGTLGTVVGTNGNVIRVLSNGALDSTFSVEADGPLETIVLQADGRLLIGDWFDTVNKASRYGLARTLNTEAANDALEFAGSTLTWVRSATSSEFVRVSFESSTNGSDWRFIGPGARVPAGWQITGVNFPAGSSIRARGFLSAHSGIWNGTTWFVERGMGVPFLTANPLSQTAEEGDTVRLTIGAEGSGPLTYQWQLNGTNLANATSAMLNLTNFQAANAGNYSVVVSGSAGAVTSSVAAITLITLTERFASPSMLHADVVSPTPAGRILVNGRFWTWRGDKLYSLGRLHSNGTWDASFEPGELTFYGLLAVQPDGKCLVVRSGSAAGEGSPFVRLTEDGVLDPSFSPRIGGTVWGASLQPDDKVLIWGSFTSVDDQPCTNFARLQMNGSLDLAFRPGAEGQVKSIAFLDGGQLLVGGQFTSLGGQPCTNLARLSKDGILDVAFRPSVIDPYLSALPQSDGRIIVRGDFPSATGTGSSGFGRLNADGSWDTEFQTAETKFVRSVAQQANGKTLVLSYPLTHPTIRRLNTNGSVDPGFSVELDADSMVLLEDGDVLLTGRDGVSRVENAELALQELRFTGDSITWLRSGAAPEVDWARFEASTNGSSWFDVGIGKRIPGGWQVTDLTLPVDARIRARAQVHIGAFLRLSYIIEEAIGAPYFMAQLGNQRRPVGTKCTFTAGVEGTKPLHFQWFLNSSRMVGETNAILTMNRLQPADEGLYSVVVTNVFGSATSSVARLETFVVPAPPAPVIQELCVTNSGVRFSFDTLVGGEYLVQCAPDPNALSWSSPWSGKSPTLATSYRWDGTTDIITALGTTLTVTDKVNTNQHLYYRVVALPRLVE